MTEFDLGKHRRARLWLGEPCPVTFVPEQMSKRTFHVERGPCEGWSVAIEVVVPRGGMRQYGLLGASLVPGGQRDQLRVEVAYGNGDLASVPFAGLGGPLEKAFAGLPGAFVDSVYEGVTRALIAEQDPGPGVLSFDRAVHSLVGSSHAIFTALAETVVVLLSARSASQDEVKSLLVGALDRPS